MQPSSWYWYNTFSVGPVHHLGILIFLISRVITHVHYVPPTHRKCLSGPFVKNSNIYTLMAIKYLFLYLTKFNFFSHSKWLVVKYMEVICSFIMTSNHYQLLNSKDILLPMDFWWVGILRENADVFSFSCWSLLFFLI